MDYLVCDKTGCLSKSVKLMRDRANDKQAFVRKSFFSSITDLSVNQLRSALDLKDLNLVKILFTHINDEELSLSVIKVLISIAEKIMDGPQGNQHKEL